MLFHPVIIWRNGLLHTSKPSSHLKETKLAPLQSYHSRIKLRKKDQKISSGSVFFTNLSTKGYNVLRLEEVDERLRLAAIDASSLDTEDVYKVGRIVKADALIYGVVTKCCKRFFGVYSQVVFGAEMKMVDARYFKIIWQADHTETTHSGSVPVSPFSVPEAVIESSINVREKGSFRNG